MIKAKIGVEQLYSIEIEDTLRIERASKTNLGYGVTHWIGYLSTTGEECQLITVSPFPELILDEDTYKRLKVEVGTGARILYTSYNLAKCLEPVIDSLRST